MYGYWALITWLLHDCTVNYRPVFSSEKAPSKEEKRNCQTKKGEQAKIWSRVTKRRRRTGWLTVGRKNNSNSSNVQNCDSYTNSFCSTIHSSTRAFSLKKLKLCPHGNVEHLLPVRQRNSYWNDAVIKYTECVFRLEVVSSDSFYLWSCSISKHQTKVSTAYSGM
jgi:hypothetical protein